MANTHHCKNKNNARKMAKKLRKYGNKVSMSKTKKGWSVSAWK